MQGTTGSGKTLVYFEALKPLIEKGFQGLILLPEIGLTSQFEQKFLEYFGFIPAVWHSGISKKKKELIWSGVSNGKIKIIIGARSSLFLPFKKLGMIIVDEERDQSFKQDEGITYNARDMAISRASFENIPINLITAVPSIETFENIKKGKYEVSRLNERYQNAALPNYEIINLNNIPNEYNSYSFVSTILIILQILLIYQLSSMLLNKKNDKDVQIFQNRLKNVMNLFNILNFIIAMIMNIILQFFTTDG